MLGFCFENRVYATRFKNAADGNLNPEKLTVVTYIPALNDKNFYFRINLFLRYS